MKIKWPNDILYDGRKIAGILIENILRGSSLDYSVIGIGLNINQTEFQNSSASSLRLITGLQFDINEKIEFLLMCIEKRYLHLKNGDHATMLKEYYARLYKFNEVSSYSCASGTFQGTIRGVDEQGHLLIEKDKQISAFGFKEVQFL